MKVGQSFSNGKKVAIITNFYTSRISGTKRVEYSLKHDLGTYSNTTSFDKFMSMVEGWRSGNYFINLRTKCCVSDNWCMVTYDVFNGWKGQKEIKF